MGNIYQEKYRLSDVRQMIKGYCTDQSNSNLGYKTNNIVPLKGCADNEENC